MPTSELSLTISHLLPEFEDCRSCRERLVSGLRGLPGVHSVSAHAEDAEVRLSFDHDLLPADELERRAAALGLEVASHFRHGLFSVRGMDCSECARTIEKGMARRDGVASVSVSFPTATMLVEFDGSKISEFEIERAVRRLGYGVEDTCECADHDHEGHKHEERERFVLQLLGTQGAWATLVAGLFMLGGFILGATSVPDWLGTGCFGAAFLVAGARIAWRGVLNAFRARTLDMYFLMTVACVGAACMGDWSEAGGAMFLFSLGTTLETFTFDRARGAIRSVLALSPTEARVVRDGRETMVRVEDVSAGERLVVRPGEKIPLDGVVLAGTTAVNQAPITGESLPVVKSPGDWVYAGSLNGQGNVEIEARRPYRENTIARIIHLVEKAQAGKAPAQRTIERFARWYTPAVLLVALLVATVAPLLSDGAGWGTWIGRAMVLLVVACPCALVISTPVSVISAIATASRKGVLVKGGSHLEVIGTSRVVVFDKTGTVTLGHHDVEEVVPVSGASRDRLLSLAAALGARSEHPLSMAIAEHARRERVSLPEVEAFESVPGRGARGRIEGQEVRLGSRAFLESEGVACGALDEVLARIEGEGRTSVLVSLGGEALGAVALGDRLREKAVDCVRALRTELGQEVILLSGDSPAVARAVGRQLGIDEVHGGVLPERKVEVVREMRERHGRVVMVGDGVNDAPALKEATVGIAMGAAGSDLAIETADIALMADDLSRVPFLIRLSRRTVSTIRWNIAASLLVKFLFFGLALAGWVNLWGAVASDMGVSLLVTLNGMRLLSAER